MPVSPFKAPTGTRSSPRRHGGRTLTGLLVAASMGLGMLAATASSAVAAVPDPVGSLDTVYAVPGGVGLTGWAAQPDNPTLPNDVHFYLDGQFLGWTNAGASRPDVAAAMPGYGPGHGFVSEVPYGGSGTHQVCAFAINHVQGATNPLLGCKSVVLSSPVTAQMRSAADWAVAEMHSPDPTWSDHFGHAWSGWCEEFAEQAEGFPQTFPTALSQYTWQRDHGRIHTDTNPPVGAVVFWDGGSAGHVAISIGGGQAVGTYGNVGQRLAVRQYPVVGFLTNNYLGWANPVGS
jgi:hypothetical protein